MKRQDNINSSVGLAVCPLIGQLIEPVRESRLEASKRKEVDQEPPRYRLEQLLGQEVGKRTFLAIDIRSNAQVVIKLLLYCPDPQEKEIEAALSRQQASGFEPSELSTMLPYLASFEVETSLGEGLALVKPYTHQSVNRQSANRQSAITHRPDHQVGQSEGQPVAMAPAYRQTTADPRIAYADFQIKSVPDKLSIQFLESRICAGTGSEDGLGDSLEFWLSAIAGTIVFVGGAVVATGSIVLGVIVAALLPVLFKYFTALQRLRGAARRQATIRLSRESKGRTFLSLTTALMPKKNNARNVSTPPIERSIETKLHYSRLSVKNVTVAPAFFFLTSSGWQISGAKLTFTFYNHDAPSSQLCVVGTYQEIRWIHRHLLQWAKPSRSSE